MVVVMMAKRERNEFIITTLSRVPLQHTTRAGAPYKGLIETTTLIDRQQSRVEKEAASPKANPSPFSIYSHSHPHTTVLYVCVCSYIFNV
jgi:hypothetical protein